LQTDEDCLYLNVWVPGGVLTKVKSDQVLDHEHYVVAPDYQKGVKSLPVMVWFYGGNFRNGGGTCTLYDGRFMAEMGNVIVVTTNYRFDFVSHSFQRRLFLKVLECEDCCPIAAKLIKGSVVFTLQKRNSPTYKIWLYVRSNV